MTILVAILLFYTVTEHSVMVSARGCPGSTCISPVWLERCQLSLSHLSLLCRGTSVQTRSRVECIIRHYHRCFFGLPPWQTRSAWLVRLCWDVRILQPFFTISSSCSYPLWDLPVDVLAAPASALCGWIGVILSLWITSVPSFPEASFACNRIPLYLPLRTRLIIASNI